MSGSDVEHRYLDIVGHVKRKVGIPVSVKLPTYFSAVANFVARLESIGTDGVVLFNRFYRPDLDVKTLSVQRRPVLSSPADIHLPLTWTALLSRRLKVSLAAGTGVDSHVEVVKFLLAGANVVATASALVRHGPEHMASWSTPVKGCRKAVSHRSRRSAAGSTPPTSLIPTPSCAPNTCARCLARRSRPDERGADMRVALFSAKKYERKLLDELNAEHRHDLVYFDTLLEPETASLAAGFPAVSVFTNDTVDGDVLKGWRPAARAHRRALHRLQPDRCARQATRRQGRPGH